MKKEIFKWLKALLLVVPIFVVDRISENYISRNTLDKTTGCIKEAYTKTGKSGIYSIFINRDSARELTLYTYDASKARAMNDQINQCFEFEFYRHSFLIPNVGKAWVVNINNSADQ